MAERNPTVRMLGTADGDLALHDFGGTGPTALLLHGLTANARSLDAVVDDVGDLLHLVALDFRGRGLSGPPQRGPAIPGHAADAAAAIRAIGGPVRLIGHSLGALVALWLAAAEPGLVERLVLIDGAGDVPPANLEAIGPSLKRLELEYEDDGEYLAMMRAAPHLQPWNDYIEAFARLDAMQLGNGHVRSRIDPRQIVEELTANAELPSLRASQEAIGCPTLILRGAAPVAQGVPPVFDRQSCLDAHAAIRDSLLVELPRAHHYSIALQPNPLRRAALRDFLA